MYNAHENCPICQKGIRNHERTVTCTSCSRCVHQPCLPIYSDVDIEYANDPSNCWTCTSCWKQLFPFHMLETNEELSLCLANNNQVDLNRLSNMIFEPFNDDDEGFEIDDLDPDSNFYNDQINTITANCKYLYPDKLKDKLSERTGKNAKSFFHLNIRSLKKNYKQLLSLIDMIDNKFSVIGLTESWLKEYNHTLFDIDGYNHVALTRTTGMGGGISMFIDDSLNFKIRTDLGHSDSDIEMSWIEIEKNKAEFKKNTIVGTVYRRPGTDIRRFNQMLDNVFQTLHNEKKDVLYMGDTNIDLLKSDNHPLTCEFLDLNLAHALIPYINKPTRVTGTTATLIDNIFSNLPSEPLNFQTIIPVDISDHFPVCLFLFDNDKSNNKKIIRKKRDFSNTNKLKFNKKMQETNWDTITNDNVTQSAYSAFHNIITNAFEHCFPYKQVKSEYQERLPWLTQAIKNSIKRKHKLYTKQLKHHTQENIKIYKTFRNRLNHVMRISERSYYQNKIIEYQSNLRKSWKVINSVINRKKRSNMKNDYMNINGLRTDDPVAIANHFNKFFTEVGHNLDKKIQTTLTNPLQYITSRQENTLFLIPCTNEEITKIINNLKRCATGWDGIPAAIIQENKEIFSNNLTHIINLSLAQGVFPTELKLANLIPIFKAGDPELAGNYRPVSLLTAFSKVFERVFYNRLLSFFQRYKILYDMQFGFREKRSTEMAIMMLLDKIIDALEKGRYVIGIFLDFSKAFDTVNHKILLSKLETYGVRGIANDWLASYLDKRTQYCTFNGHKSSTRTINCGVPQGSILGPLLFLAYINDLGEISNKWSTLLFADDTNVFAEGTELDTLQNLVNNEIPMLIDWLRANRLSLNVKKTNTMIFGKAKDNIKKRIKIVIEGHTLDVVNKSKFLGLMVDDCLNWKEHTLYLAKKAAKSIGILSLARQVFNRSTLIQLYYSFIFPYISYCNLAWGGATSSNLWVIYRIQKIALRLILNVKKGSSTREECKTHLLLRLPEIHLYSVAIFMYKYKNQMLPSLFNDFFKSNRDTHQYNTRNATKLRPPRAKTTLASKFIKKTGANLWNLLEDNIEVNCSIGIFKRQLKTYLVKDY